MDFKVEQVTEETEESVKVCCHDTNAEWVNKVHEAVLGQAVIFGNKEGKMHQIKLSDVYYFEVVDGKSFIYTKKEVFTAKEYKIDAINKTVKTTLTSYSRSYGLDVSSITGAKSGFTDGAGLCLASTATMDNVDYLLVTLGASTKTRSNAVKDSLEIYDYYNTNYSYQTVITKNQKIKTLPIKWGKEKNYTITSKKDISLYLSNDIRKNRIKYIYSGLEEINYKYKKGDKIGTVKIVYEDNTLYQYNVYLEKKLEFYHPVLYGMIIILVILMLYSLKYILRSRNYKRNRRNA